MCEQRVHTVQSGWAAVQVSKEGHTVSWTCGSILDKPTLIHIQHQSIFGSCIARWCKNMVEQSMPSGWFQLTLTANLWILDNHTLSYLSAAPFWKLCVKVFIQHLHLLYSVKQFIKCCVSFQHQVFCLLNSLECCRAKRWRCGWDGAGWMRTGGVKGKHLKIIVMHKIKSIRYQPTDNCKSRYAGVSKKHINFWWWNETW